MTRVLGLIFSGHGTSACLVEDGEIKRAVNLERLTREKFSLASLPSHQEHLKRIRRNVFGVTGEQTFFDFFEVFPDLLEYTTGARTIPQAELDLVVKVPDNIKPIGGPEDPDYRRFLTLFDGTKTHFDLEHHLCHGYQAFLTSPFERAAVLTIDGTGQPLQRLGGKSICASLGIGEGVHVQNLSEVLSTFSLGGMYASHTSHLGFKTEQEGNTMALAAFGNEEYWEQLRDIPLLKEDGTYEFRRDAVKRLPEWHTRMPAYCARRSPDEPIEQVHKNLAYGVQRLTEECVLNAARGLAARTGLKRIAIAGGVALNCVANTKILTETPIEEIHVMPNAGDRGLAAGAALYGYHVVLGHEQRRPPRHDYLGKTYGDREIDAAIHQATSICARRSSDIASDVAELLAKGRIVAWVQGGSEYGPRALGHRSILADPRTHASKVRLDQEIKRREWFRPYAPSALAEHANEYFELHGPSPYMLQAVMTRPEKREEVAGIVHVDGTARVQTIDREIEPLYHRLVSEFQRHTGVPIVLNTSFNGYGEPVVETPQDAIAAMKAMGLDALALGEMLVWRSDRMDDLLSAPSSR